jgi:hypothetical protein
MWTSESQDATGKMIPIESKFKQSEDQDGKQVRRSGADRRPAGALCQQYATNAMGERRKASVSNQPGSAKEG